MKLKRQYSDEDLTSSRNQAKVGAVDLSRSRSLDIDVDAGTRLISNSSGGNRKRLRIGIENLDNYDDDDDGKNESPAEGNCSRCGQGAFYPYDRISVIYYRIENSLGSDGSPFSK